MRKTLALFFSLAVLWCDAQTDQKEHRLNRYFLSIPVQKPVGEIRQFIDTSSRFRVDSITEKTGLTATVEKAPEPFPDSSKLVLQVFQMTFTDAAAKNVYDTATIVRLYCETGKSRRAEDAATHLYKTVVKEFSTVYAYADGQARGKKPYKTERNVFKTGRFDNYPQLTVFKGYDKSKEAYYITLIFEKRKHYLVKRPEIFIRL